MAKINYQGDAIKVRYAVPASRRSGSHETGVVGWLSARGGPRFFRADLILGYVYPGYKQALNARYRLDPDGKARDMHVNGLHRSIHTSTEILTNLYGVILNNSTQSYIGSNVDKLYGSSFGSAGDTVSLSYFPDVEINEPGASFAFGNDEIVAALKNRISIIAPPQLGTILYRNIYERLYKYPASLHPRLEDSFLDPPVKK